MSDSLPPHELYPVRLLCPWNSPSKSTHGIFPTPGSNPHFLLYRQILYHWATWEAHEWQYYIYIYLGIHLEKAMTPYSGTLAWKIPWAEEPSRLQSMGSLRVRHDWATSLSLFTFMHWRRKWQPTPVFLPGESQGWGSLVGCCLWGCTELNTTEAT